MTLNLYSIEERDDLVAWLDRLTKADADEAGYRDHRASLAWLATQVPGRIEVPGDHAGDILLILADWSEVLAAHGEPFHTTEELP